MEKEKLKLLKEVLSIPSYFEYEFLVQDFLIKYGNEKGYDVTQDDYGNVYFEKGKIKENEYFPCVCAHIDTVFNEHIELIEANKRKVIKQHDRMLMAFHPDTDERTGLGGDDLAGVFICLQQMEKFDSLKAAFFVEEEFGAIGSTNCDPLFFDNVGYVLQFDGPTDNWYTETLNGVNIFNDAFDKEVKPILEKYGVDNYSADPYTDVLPLTEKFDFACANLPTGYYNWHTVNEYVNIDHVSKGIKIGEEFINKLGLKKHLYKLNNLRNDMDVDMDADVFFY